MEATTSEITERLKRRLGERLQPPEDTEADSPRGLLHPGTRPTASDLGLSQSENTRLAIFLSDDSGPRLCHAGPL